MKINTVIITTMILLLINPAPASSMNPDAKPNGFKANITFFYYKDVAKAADFYMNTMGFEPVLDYGFAKAFRASKSAIICLVDETKGMHKTTEPKSVTFSIISRQVDGWYHYLKKKGVKMRSPVRNSKRLPIRGFVAYDPEGYFLEFETFLHHDQNKNLLHILDKTKTLYPPKSSGTRPQTLGIQGNILWLYYKDLKAAQKFYEANLGLELLVDQGFAKVYTSSPSAFIGLVDESKGMHKFSAKKSVNVGFITNEVDKWYDYLFKKGLKMRGPVKIAEQGRVRAFLTYDCAGYHLEFDTFLPHETNNRIIEIIGK